MSLKGQTPLRKINGGFRGPRVMVYEARLDTFAAHLESRDGKSDQEKETATSGQLEEENSSYCMSTSRERVGKKE